MEKKTDIKEILKEMRTSPFVLGCGMELGSAQGLPILSVRAGRLCLTAPYLRYKMTGKPDGTLVYPIRYTVTLTLPDRAPAAFEDLKYNAAFRQVDFSRPVGTFRHDAVKRYGKDEYFALKDELLELYGKTADMLLYGGAYAPEDERRMAELLSLLVEPSLKPIYRLLDRDFYEKYMEA